MILALQAVAAAAAMQLGSPDFHAGGTIPTAFMAARCGGRNVSPTLVWSGAPKSARSFALILHDPDAPMAGGFYHWVVYDVPASAHRLGADSSLQKARVGIASTGTAAYHGPCPPPGPAHHYVFTLYALDVATVGGHMPLTAPQLQTALRGHVLARAEFEATAETPSR
jgi:hypothetical protein